MDYNAAIDAITKDTSLMAYRKSLGDLSEESAMFMYNGKLSTFESLARVKGRKITKEDLRATDWEVVSLNE